MKRVQGTVGSPGSQAPPLLDPPRARLLLRPAPHVRPRPVQRWERGGRAAPAASERAAQGPRGRLGLPRRPPPLPPLGLSGPRAGAASREDGAALPGQCALRRGSPLRRPGNQATRWVWGPRAEDGGGGRGIADPRPGDPGTGRGCTPRARAGGGHGPSPGAAGGGAEAGLGGRPSAEVWMMGAGTKGGFGGAQVVGSRPVGPACRPRLRAQRAHSWDGARERPWVRRWSGGSGWTLIGQSGPGPCL